ncbi:SDR family oxidoreductase [Streptomyces sp. NPDC001852]|uniref:SDR family oxidoreductase n=1 Tax=Streptomyces sp. NPDC001852 TaxID=3364619 RepID=UPI0036BB9F16
MRLLLPAGPGPLVGRHPLAADHREQFQGALRGTALRGGVGDEVLVGTVGQLQRLVVQVSSIAGTRMFAPDYAVYSDSEAAVNAASESLRAELGPQGVRVTDIQPGLVTTELGEHTSRAESRQVIAGLFRQHRALAPDELADVIAYVVSRPPHLNMPQLVVTPVTQ